MSLEDLRAKVARLEPFSPRIRPSNSDSFPIYLEGELRRLANASRDAVSVLKDLDARLASLGG